MKFLSAAHTDAGIVKKENQDAFCVEIASTPQGRIAMAVLCDGMGGLKKGDVASGNCIIRFVKWFETEMPKMPSIGSMEVQDQWAKIVAETSRALSAYGASGGFSLGTTLTGLLLVGNIYLTVQVGDSRAYKLSDRKCNQITKDQSLVAREVEQGKITKEQAKKDPRRNVLLQCIGTSEQVNPVFSTGTFKAGDVFLLCSDGFVHEVSEDEMCGVLSAEVLPDENTMKKNLIGLIDLVKSRKERDNITALLLKAV